MTENAGVTLSAASPTASGAVTFSAAGSTGSLTVNGTVDGSFNGNMSFVAGLGGSISLGSGAQIALGTNDDSLTIQADTISIAGAAGSITGGTSGHLTIETLQQGTTIGIGAGAAGTFQVTNGALAAISAFSSLTIGDVYGGNSAVAATTIAGPVTFPVPTAIYSSGSIGISGNVSIAAGQALTLAAGEAGEVNNSLSGNGSVTFAAGSGLSYTGSATAASSLSIGVVGSSNTITLGSVTAGTSSPLTVTLNALGAITLPANVTTSGGSFSATSSGAGGSVTENAGVTLSAASPTASGAVTFSATGSTGSLTVNGTVDGSFNGNMSFVAGLGGSISLGSGAQIALGTNDDSLTIQARTADLDRGGARGRSPAGRPGTSTIETLQPGNHHRCIGAGAAGATFQVTQRRAGGDLQFLVADDRGCLRCSNSAVAATTIAERR